MVFIFASGSESNGGYVGIVSGRDEWLFLMKTIGPNLTTKRKQR